MVLETLVQIEDVGFPPTSPTVSKPVVNETTDTSVAQDEEDDDDDETLSYFSKLAEED